MPRNRFYARKYANLKISPEDFREPADLARLPFVSKAELIADQREHPPYGDILTYPLESYSRLHQTSGTTSGKALCWLDTPASWESLLKCWQDSFPYMGLTPKDRFFFPFSFGPFIGFWSAFEAASHAGFLCIPGGGMTSTARLRFLMDHAATVICCTPTYALHLAELASQEGIDLAGSSVRVIIVAGEPGGSISATRQRIETVWGARVFDHYGMTEVGPVAVEMVNTPRNMALLEDHYIAEIIEPLGSNPVAIGDVGELVLTNLGRAGSPLIRYRTGDLVKQQKTTAGLFLEGGILGRTDDMIHIRGNNLYPAALEAVVRRFPEVVEFRIVIDESGPLADLRIEIEPALNASSSNLADAVGRAIRDELLFRVEVTAVATGTLPRFEMKARRIQRIL
ncbi:MAG: AMP-binding protein [Planctomycetes bacterium]|nr:AMP-binding protein [Planctomycetota bacterium]